MHVLSQPKYDYEPDFKETPLIAAVVANDIEEVKSCLELKEVDLHAQSYTYGTALVAAIFLQHESIFDFLLGQEQAFDITRHPGALLTAIRADNTNMVDKLIAKGASVDDSGEENYQKPPYWFESASEKPTPFDYSGPPVFELPVIVALQENKQNALRALLGHSPDLDKKGSSNYSANDLIGKGGLDASITAVLQEANEATDSQHHSIKHSVPAALFSVTTPGSKALEPIPTEKKLKKDLKDFNFSQLAQYFFEIENSVIREQNIDDNLSDNKLERRRSTSVDNNCLLDTIFQSITEHFQLYHYVLIDKIGDLQEFIDFIRKKIGKEDEEMLSINDDTEGVKILQAVQKYLHSKINQIFGFELTVLLADNDGEVGIVDMSIIQHQIGVGNVAIPIKMVYVNYNHYEPVFNKYFIVNPKFDKFQQNKLGWIQNVGGESHASMGSLIDRFKTDKDQDEKNLNLINELLCLVFSGSDAKFLKNKIKINYSLDKFLERTPAKESKGFELRKLVEFYAHLVSMNADIALSIPEADKRYYIEQGIINEIGQTTHLFRQQPLFQGLIAGQKRWDGMKSDEPLILFHTILSRIHNDKNHRSSRVAGKLLPILDRALYIKLLEQQNYNILKKVEEIAKHFLRQQAGNNENLMIHSGHYQHTFYVNLLTNIEKNKIILQFNICNFNGTAIQMNQMAAKESNDFYPYVIKLEVPRLEIIASGKEKVRKDFTTEIEQTSFYISMLQLSSIEGRYYIKKAGNSKFLKKEVRVHDKIKEKLISCKDEFLQQIRDKLIDRKGFFSWGNLRNYLESSEFNGLFEKLIDKDWQSRDEKIRYYLLQHVQTIICLDVIYHPFLYGANLLQHQPEIERSLPSNPIQQTGNCTVFNLKAALYSLAGLDWREPADLNTLQLLNFDINMLAINLIRECQPKIDELVAKTPKNNIPLYSSMDVKADAQIIKTNEMCKKGKKQDALELAKKICENNPDFGYVFVNLGKIYEDLQQKEEALEAYHAAMELIDDSRIYNACGAIYSEKGEEDKALEFFEESLKLNPFNPLVYYNSAVLYSSKKEYDKALENINKLIELQATPEHILFRIQILFDMKSYSQAVNDVNYLDAIGYKSNDYYFTALKTHFVVFDAYYNLYVEDGNSCCQNEIREKLSEHYISMKKLYVEMVKLDPKNKVNNSEAWELILQSKEKYSCAVQQYPNKFLYWEVLRNQYSFYSFNSEKNTNESENMQEEHTAFYG